MKKITFLFALCFFVSGLSAQISIDYDTVITDIVDNYFETVGHNTIHNNSPAVVSFEWIRNEVTLETAWATQVCDRNQCYFFAVDTQRFELGVDSSSVLDIHVHTNSVFRGYGLVELALTNLNDPSQVFNSVYIFDSEYVGTRKLDFSDFKVFPNPSKGLFNVANDEDKIQTIEVHSASGMLMKRVDIRDRQIVDIIDLPKGSYILKLIGQDAKPLGTKLISKL